MFAEWFNVPIRGADRPMPNATANNITIIDFSMGSANAATILDLLSCISPKACLFLGKCGGLKDKIPLGGFILPLFVARAPQTIIFRPKYLPCLRLLCKKLFQLPSATITTTIGQVVFIPPTAEFGNTITNLKTT